MKFKILLIFLILSSIAYADFQEPSSTQGEPIHIWWNTIVDVCNDDYNLDPYLISAMVKKESWFDENAENIAEKNAYLSGQNVWYENYWGKGLTQVTGPWTAGVPTPIRENWEYNMPIEAVWEEAPIMNYAFNGRENLARGCWYFSVLMEHYNNDEFSAVTAYNKGFFGVDRGDYNVRNNDYVNDVMRYKNDYLATVENNEDNNSTIHEIGLDVPDIPENANITIPRNDSNDIIDLSGLNLPPIPNGTFSNNNENNSNRTTIIPFFNNDFDNDKREYGPAGRNNRRSGEYSTNNVFTFDDNFLESGNENKKAPILELNKFKDTTMDIKKENNYYLVYSVLGVLIFILLLKLGMMVFK